jgi:pSer/pThr/pTyr-binding forkhead associated (FHA) protein
MDVTQPLRVEAAPADGTASVLDLSARRLGTVLVVGRGRASHVRLADSSVSRVHAELRRTAAGWLVIDRGSRHGTWRRGRRVSRALVGPGDELAFGAVRVRLRVADPR